MSYETDWIKVGVAGKTVDGRDIDEQWLLDAARLYDLQEYQAQVWTFSHWSKYETYGTVTALKSGRDSKKRLALYAKIKPEPYLIELNRRGQLKYTSMEIRPNYKGNNMAYMTGLLFTNNPASTGIEQINLSADQGDKEVNLSAPEAFSASLDDPTESVMPAWFKPFAKLFTGGQPPADPIEEDVVMTPEQFEKFEAFQTRQNELLEQNLNATKALETKLEGFTVQAPPAANPEQPATPAAGATEQPAGEENKIPSQEEFAAMIGTAVEKYMNKGDGNETETPEGIGDNEGWKYDY